MFNSTHSFVGLTIARTGVERWVRCAAVTALIAANLPDIDIVTGFAGTATYLQYHRGITHTFVGIPVLALLLAAVMYFFSGSFWKTYAVALIAMATHPVLDLTNTYGLRPFLPWSGQWYYGDLLPIIDPYLDGILLIGILGGEVFRNKKRLITWVSLGLAVVYLGARLELRSMAAAELQTFAVKTPGAEKWAVIPGFLNPLKWEGIIQYPDQMVRVSLDPMGKLANEITRMQRTDPSRIPKQALGSQSAVSLLSFMRFPVMRLESTAYSYHVVILDFRFYDEGSNTALASEIELNRSLQITKESVSFQKSLE